MARKNSDQENETVTLDGVLGEFRDALKEEIQASRIFESSNAVDLKNGKRFAKVGNNYQYLFEIDNALNLPGDTPGDLLVPQKPPISIIIVSIEGLAITISIPEDIGNFVPSARLKSNLTYLMNILIERIENYSNKPNPVGERIRGANTVSGSEINIELQEEYNEYQKRAIESSIGRDTTFIWGPPGTGKTHTIGEIGFQLYKRNRAILLVSHTNTAVDQAILRIGGKIPDDDLEKGKAIRVGDPKDKRLIDHPNLLLQTHVDRRSKTLTKKRYELNQELEKKVILILGITKFIDLHEWVESSKKSIQALINDLKEIKIIEDELITLNTRFSLAEKKRAFYQKATVYADQLNDKFIREAKLGNDIVILKKEVKQTEQTLKSIADEISKHKQVLDEIKSTGLLFRKWKGLPAIEDQEFRIQVLEVEYGELGLQLDQLRSRLIEMQIEHNRIIQTIEWYRAKHGGLPDELKKLVSEHDELILGIEQEIRKNEELSNSYRSKLEESLKARLKVLQEFGLVDNIPKTAELMLRLILKAYGQAKVKIKKVDIESLKTNRDALNNRIASIEKEISEIDEIYKKIEETIISEADVVATTLTRAYLRESVQSRRFDTVILDEASMAPIPALWIAAGLADRNAVVVGDPKQLPPIVISEKDIAKKWLGRDIFEEAGLTDYGLQVPHLAPLWMQYRMHPDISVVVNDLIYNHLLIDGQIKNGADECPLWDARCDRSLFNWYYQDWGYDNPVLLIDTGPLNAWVTSVPGGKRSSRLNFLSATVCVDLAERILKDERPYLKIGDSPRIIIMSPYRPHSRLIGVLIKDQGLENEIRSGTVHNFQGSEADLVIFDLVNDEPHWQVGMFIPALYEDMKRLINVALTRAKRRLFVVGDFDYIQRQAKKAFLGGELIPYLKEGYPCVDANYVVPCGLASRSAKARARAFGGKVEEDAARLIMTQERFYPSFLEDLKNANKKIIIYSPFITQDRLAYMEPSLKAAVERGVRVFVITKASGDRGKREIGGYILLEDALEKWGVVIIHKRRMHEKLAIIDNSILWIGSLNILSFSSTQEIMERRFSKTVVEDFVKTLRLNDLLKEYDSGRPACPICESEIVASEGRNEPYYWRCIIDGCYSRSINQPPLKSGTITCNNCGGNVEYGYWGQVPHWRCIKNRMHRQRVVKTHLTLPETINKIPKKELKKLKKNFGIENWPATSNRPR